MVRVVIEVPDQYEEVALAAHALIKTRKASQKICPQSQRRISRLATA
jgi:hypothetical protein